MPRKASQDLERRPTNPETCAFNAGRAAVAAKEAAGKAADISKGMKLSLEALASRIMRLSEAAASAARAAGERAVAGDANGARQSWQESERYASEAICAEQRFRGLGDSFVVLVARAMDEALPSSHDLNPKPIEAAVGRFALLEVD